MLVALPLLLYNCDEDDFQEEQTIDIEEVAPEISVTIIDLSEIAANTKMLETLEKLSKANLISKTTNRDTITSNEYGFIIDTDYVKYVENGNYNSYNFEIIRDSPEDDKLENLFLTLNEDEEYDTFIIKYDFTLEELNSLTQEELDNKTTQYTTIDFDTSFLNRGNSFRDALECESEWVWIPCSMGGDHGDGSSCDGGWSSKIVCSGGGGPGPGPSSGDVTSDITTGGNQGSGGSGGSNSGTYTPPSNPYSAPTCADCPEFNPENYFDATTDWITTDQTFENTTLECIHLNLRRESESSLIKRNFYTEMLNEFNNLGSPRLKYSIGTPPNNTAWAFTKGQVTDFAGITYDSYEIISSSALESSSNLKQIVSLSHELIHAFMYQSLVNWNIINFDASGFPIVDPTTLCQNFVPNPNINLNTVTIKDRWVYLICEFNANNPGDQQWTHSLFDSPVFAVQTYREKLEQLLLSEHDWDSEPDVLKNMMITEFGTDWKEKCAEYMSWSGLDETPEYSVWLNAEGINNSYWEGITGPWTNPDWVNSNSVLNNCN